jgi:hypothetical protein
MLTDQISAWSRRHPAWPIQDVFGFAHHDLVVVFGLWRKESIDPSCGGSANQPTNRQLEA